MLSDQHLRRPTKAKLILVSATSSVLALTVLAAPTPTRAGAVAIPAVPPEPIPRTGNPRTSTPSVDERAGPRPALTDDPGREDRPDGPAERIDVDADTSLITDNLLGSVLSGGGSTPTPNTPEPGPTWSTATSRPRSRPGSASR